MDENEPWLLIEIPSRDPFLVTQYLERHSESSERDGLHVMIQCHSRQHFADRYWLHEHPGRRIVEGIYDEEIHRRIDHLL